MANKDTAGGHSTIGGAGPGNAGGGGAFPGFGGIPPAIAGAGSAGVAGTASRSDHTHAGVTSVNGAQGAVVLTAFPGFAAANGVVGPSVAGAAGTAARSDHQHPVISVATFAALGALSAAVMDAGTQAYVVSAKTTFILEASAVAVRTNVRIAATGKAGFQWVRQIVRNPVWEMQTVWVIDPANSTGVASDDNDGLAAGSPLLTYTEHAMRLADAEISVVVAVTTLPGSQQAADKPVYTCNVISAGSLTFTGTLTSIYTGVVTTYAAGAAAPSVDDGYTIIDATIPVSFTASGLLANGVLFKRTNGTAAYWWAAKDMGGAAPAAKLRISVPVTSAGNAAIALANADTYQAYTLPTITFMRFVNAQGVLLNQNVVFTQFNFSNVIERAPNNVTHVNCYEAGFLYTGAAFQNSCFNGSTIIWWPMGPSPNTASFGLIRSGGQLIVTGGPVVNWLGRLVCQNSTIHPNESSFQFVGDLAGYDLAAGSILVADYWSVVFFQAGAFCGNGNVGNTVILANKWSQIVFMVAAFALAGSFLSATPYSVGPTAFSEAQIDAGTANQMATKGNGIYPST